MASLFQPKLALSAIKCLFGLFCLLLVLVGYAISAGRTLTRKALAAFKAILAQGIRGAINALTLSRVDVGSKAQRDVGLCSILEPLSHHIKSWLPKPSPQRRQPPPLLAIPVDIRRLVYDYLLPETLYNNDIHLTYNPHIDNLPFPVPEPAKFFINQDMQSLLLSCGALNAEMADLIYGTNTFTLMPGRHNYNATRAAYPTSIGNIWLNNLHWATCQRVQKLRVYLTVSMAVRQEWLVEALAAFPNLEVVVQPVSEVRLKNHKQRCEKLGKMCAAIHEARGEGMRTAWSCGGNAEVLEILEKALGGSKSEGEEEIR